MHVKTALEATLYNDMTTTILKELLSSGHFTTIFFVSVKKPMGVSFCSLLYSAAGKS
jgi:hypothetical protein